MIVIKLGGSIILDSDFQVNPDISKFIQNLSNLNEQMIITLGGGKLCRKFQDGLVQNGITDTGSLHDLGTRTCTYQAEFLRLLFPQDKTFPVVVNSEMQLFRAKNLLQNYQFIITGAWLPGHSSDFDTVIVANYLGAKRIFRISNVDYIYDFDPRTNPNAQIQKKLNWDEYLNIIRNPTEHIPGQSYPFDPLASRLARENKIKVYFTSFEKFMDNPKVDFDNFDGSVIE